MRDPARGQSKITPSWFHLKFIHPKIIAKKKRKKKRMYGGFCSSIYSLPKRTPTHIKFHGKPLLSLALSLCTTAAVMAVATDRKSSFIQTNFLIHASIVLDRQEVFLTFDS